MKLPVPLDSWWGETKSGPQGVYEPLRATYNKQRPPWIGYWSDRKYTGQPEWWAEPGLRCEATRHHKYRPGIHAKFREEDPNWYDRKVEDGTSMAGAFGMDTTAFPNLAIKGDTPGDLPEFQEKVYRGSAQYKNIAEKFPLSPEHPGVDVNPILNSSHWYTKSTLGEGLIPKSPFLKWSWGPRFFEKPMNEDCLGKGLASAKYVGFGLLPYTLFYIRNTTMKDTLMPAHFIKEYLRLSPLPLALGFTWGAMMCTSATFRNRDDIYNIFIAGGAVGAVLGSAKHNLTLGVTLSSISIFLGTLWHYQRVHPEGLQHRPMHANISGIYTGPFGWRWLQFGHTDIPKDDL